MYYNAIISFCYFRMTNFVCLADILLILKNSRFKTISVVMKNRYLWMVYHNGELQDNKVLNILFVLMCGDEALNCCLTEAYCA